MKEPILVTALANGAKRVPMSLAFALALMLMHLNAAAQGVNLGTATNFAVLAGSTITSTGPTVINGGDVGVSSSAGIAGFPPATISSPYTTHLGDAVALQAQSDLTTAYHTAAGLAPTEILTGQGLGGLTLTPGVYFFAGSAQLTGTLTLNDQGNPDALFVFQIGSTLTTATGSSVETINDPSSPGTRVFRQVGSSATLGTDTAFEGNILALASITLDADATNLDGRVMAMDGAVTLDINSITAPPAEVIGGSGSGGGSAPDTESTLLLLGSGLTALFAIGRRVSVLLR
jgi:type VI secretion system secreted protein VgrG